MENYINEDTVVNNEIYSTFKEDVICPICTNILIEPQMCMSCQNVYCKKCIDDWSKKNDKCPNRCENTNYQRSLEKKNILSKLKFNCIKCKEEIKYDEMEKHLNNCDPDKSSGTNNAIHKKKLKRIKKEDILKYNKSGNIPRITCKYLI